MEPRCKNIDKGLWFTSGWSVESIRGPDKRDYGNRLSAFLIFLSTNRLGNHPLKVEIRVRIPMGRQFRAVGELVDPPVLNKT